MPTVSGTNKYSRYRLSSHKGEYIKGETAPNRSEANRGAIPLYACFSLELSFSGKKKAEKEQLKYLSISLQPRQRNQSFFDINKINHYIAFTITFDRGSEI